MSHPDANAGGKQPAAWPEWTIRRVASTGSTNADLLAESATAADRTVLIAEHQTAGRGRLDRQWDAPAGENLLMSILFRSGFDPAAPHSLTRALALAAVEAAAETSEVSLRLKWPNDLLLNGQKCGGILAQATTTSTGSVVVVGLGLNIGWAPSEAARVPGTTPVTLVAHLLPALTRLLATDTQAMYRASLATLGQSVRVERSGDTLWGTAVDVQPDGALVVQTSTGRIAVTIGDVIHLRPGVEDGQK